MEINNESHMSFQEIIDNLFISNGYECRKLFYCDGIFYCCKDVLKCLNYSQDTDSEKEILSKINNNNKFRIKELKEKHRRCPSFLDGIDTNIDLFSSQNEEEIKYIYINQTALLELITSLKTAEANIFKDFVYKSLLPTLDTINNYFTEITEEGFIKMGKRCGEYENIIEEKELGNLSSLLKEDNDEVLDDDKKLLEYIKILKKENSTLEREKFLLERRNSILEKDYEDIKYYKENKFFKTYILFSLVTFGLFYYMSH